MSPATILLTLPAAAAATAAAESRSLFVIRMSPPVQQQQQQRAGQHTLIVQNSVEEKYEITYLVSRNQTKHAQLILELVSYSYHTRYR